MAKKEKTRWPAVDVASTIHVHEKRSWASLNHLSIYDKAGNTLDIYVNAGTTFTVMVETTSPDGAVSREEFTLAALIQLLRKPSKREGAT